MIRQILWMFFGQKEWYCSNCEKKEKIVWKNGNKYVEHQCSQSWMNFTKCCNDPKVIAKGKPFKHTKDCPYCRRQRLIWFFLCWNCGAPDNGS